MAQEKYLSRNKMGMILLCLIYILVEAEEKQNNMGKEFIVAFSHNPQKDRSAPEPLQLLISTLSPQVVNVTVSAPLFLTGTLYEIQVARTQPGKIVLPSTFRLNDSGTSNKGIYVTSDDDVTVQCVNQEKPSTGVFLALPVQSLGTEYFALTWKPEMRNSFIVVVGVHSNTCVEVRLPHSSQFNFITLDTKNYTSRDVIVRQIMQFETLQLLSTSDLTGTRIKSTSAVSVLCGNAKTSTETLYADHLVDMQVPVTAWGSTYISFPVPTLDKNYFLKIMSSKEDTSIQLKCGTSHYDMTLQTEGDNGVIEITDQNHCLITSNKPITVAQILRAKNDPSLNALVPISQFSLNHSFILPTNNNGDHFKNYFVFMIEQNASLELDSSTLNKATWHDVSGTSYVTGYFSFPSDLAFTAHTVISTSPFGGYICGWTGFEAYSMPTGRMIQSSHQARIVNLTRLNEIKEILTTEKRSTSLYRRSKISATDSRLSSGIIGFTFGVCFLCSVVIMIVIPDTIQLIRYIHHSVSTKL